MSLIFSHFFPLHFSLISSLLTMVGTDDVMNYYIFVFLFFLFFSLCWVGSTSTLWPGFIPEVSVFNRGAHSVLGNAVNYSVNDMLYKSMFENNDIETF